MDIRDVLKQKLSNDYGIKTNDYYQIDNVFTYKGQGETFGNVFVQLSMSMGTITVSLGYQHHIIIQACEYKLDTIKNPDEVIKDVAQSYDKLIERANLLVSDL